MDELLQGVKYDPAKVQEGTLLYVSNCVFCHGVPGVDRGGNIPNLGYMNADVIENLDKFVFKGPAMERGHAGLHRQAERRRTCEKIKAFIQGTGGRDPAEVELTRAGRAGSGVVSAWPHARRRAVNR